MKDELQGDVVFRCVPRVAVSIDVATAAAVTSAEFKFPGSVVIAVEETIFIGVEGVAARFQHRGR